MTGGDTRDEPIGYYNIKYGAYFHGAQLASTERNKELLDSGEIIKVYSEPQPIKLPRQSLRTLVDTVSNFCYEDQTVFTTEVCDRLIDSVIPIESIVEPVNSPSVDELQRDAERLDWLAANFKTCTVYMSGSAVFTPNHKVINILGASFRDAIDKAIAAEKELEDE